MDYIHELARAFLPGADAFLFMWLLAALGTGALFVATERWLSINRRTDYDAYGLFDKIKTLVEQRRLSDAYAICASGGSRALPRVLASGIRSAMDSPFLVSGSMTEESTHLAGAMERRLGYLVMFGNVATLFGLLGTVFGLIMSFTAVSRPEVQAVEKSALLAAGISTAMNSTLVGLSISVACVMVFAFLRAKVDSALHEIDRYAVAVLNILNPPDFAQKQPKSLVRRSVEEEAADADVTPMLNLMVMLIPVMLTSSEFVKMGAVELKLPEASAAAAMGSGEGVREQKLELGIVITSKGFSLFNYFKTESAKTAPAAQEGASPADRPVDIPLVDGKFDVETLNASLVEVKKKALVQMLTSAGIGAAETEPVAELYRKFLEHDFSAGKTFPDHESVKIVAEDKIKYQTIVEVMDAARGARTGDGSVTLFPNVSIAGGIVQ